VSSVVPQAELGVVSLVAGSVVARAELGAVLGHRLFTFEADGGGEIVAFDERGCGFLARLSHRRQNASLVCLFCWRLFLSCTVTC
jgi:hypothetical protein